MTKSRSPERLLDVLDQVIEHLEAYDLDDRRQYTQSLATQIRPLVGSLRAAIRSGSTRDQLRESLGPIDEVMREINGAATKGEMEIFRTAFGPGSPPGLLDAYWDLNTIFREAQRGQGA